MKSIEVKKREKTAKKVEDIMNSAKTSSVPKTKDFSRIIAPGNSFIVQVGYREGRLTSYTTHSPLDTRDTRQGEYVTWYWVEGQWKAWGWFNAWDESQVEGDTLVEVHLSGGGYGRAYKVPKTFHPSHPKPDWQFRHRVKDDPTFIVEQIKS